MKRKAILKFMTLAVIIIGFLPSPEAAAQKPDDTFPGDYPEYPCGIAQTVTACSSNGADLSLDCAPATLCADSILEESSGGSTYSESAGGFAPLASCNSITGTSGDDQIRVGAVYYWTGRVWATDGDLGYCKNGVLTWCSSAANPLPVKPYQGNDVVGTTGILRVCVSGSSAIGPWSALDSSWKSVALTIYGCAGTDYIYGTPNDDVLIGGSSTDHIYGKEGDDMICGDYGSYSLHPCISCSSGANCTSLGGYDTGTKMDDLCDGEDGNDTICGQAGADLLRGNDGDDTLFGEDGCDYIDAGPGNDDLYAALGSSGSGLTDSCTSNDQNELVGGGGDDSLYGSNAKDHLWGEVWSDYTAPEYDGEDYLNGYGGDDKLCGGGALNGYDDVYGGSGSDVIVYYASDYNAISCNCTDERAAEGETGDDKLFYRPIHCENEILEDIKLPCLDFPEPPGYCFGGVTLDAGGDSDYDCCDCYIIFNDVISNICDYNDCSNSDTTGYQDPCEYDAYGFGFDCPFPYLYTNLGPYWTCW